MKKINILLIGVGPHAKRIYYPICKKEEKKLGIQIVYGVDSIEKKDDIEQYFKNTSSCKCKVIDFSANINPLGLSPKAKAAIIKNIASVACYPEPYSRSLKKALGDFHGIEQDNLALGNGSIELIYLIPRALKAKRILIVTPTFSEYEFAAESTGAKIIFFKTEESENFKVELYKLQKLLPQVDLVFLGNPNNPTGSCLSAKELRSLARLCARHKTILVIDEAFMDFSKAFDEDSFLQIAPKNRFLLILRSLTKFFALPGLRIGYAAANRDLIRKISDLQYPWNINSLAQIAGQEVLNDRGYISYSREYIAKERAFLFGSLKDIKGLKAFSPASNFIFCKLQECAIKSAKVLNERLVKRGIAVRNCDNFRGLNERFFRVTIKKRDENLKLITALREIL